MSNNAQDTWDMAVEEAQRLVRFEREPGRVISEKIEQLATNASDRGQELGYFKALAEHLTILKSKLSQEQFTEIVALFFEKGQERYPNRFAKVGKDGNNFTTEP